MRHVATSVCSQARSRGVAILLRDQMNQFSMAVVLRHGVGATTIHAAGHLAVGKLMGGEPFDVLAHHAGMAQPQQRIGHHGAIADP